MKLPATPVQNQRSSAHDRFHRARCGAITYIYCSVGGGVLCVLIEWTSVYGCLGSWAHERRKVCDFGSFCGTWDRLGHAMRQPLQTPGPTSITMGVIRRWPAAFDSNYSPPLTPAWQAMRFLLVLRGFHMNRGSFWDRFYWPIVLPPKMQRKKTGGKKKERIFAEDARAPSIH